jgi:hypothetical protein
MGLSLPWYFLWPKARLAKSLKTRAVSIFNYIKLTSINYSLSGSLSMPNEAVPVPLDASDAPNCRAGLSGAEPSKQPVWSLGGKGKASCIYCERVSRRTSVQHRSYHSTAWHMHGAHCQTLSCCMQLHVAQDLDPHPYEYPPPPSLVDKRVSNLKLPTHRSVLVHSIIVHEVSKHACCFDPGLGSISPVDLVVSKPVSKCINCLCLANVLLCQELAEITLS